MELLKKYHKVSIKRGVGKYRFISSVSKGELSKKLVSLFSNTEILKGIQPTPILWEHCIVDSKTNNQDMSLMQRGRKCR